ncbi:MAG: hypothetical protein WC515_06170 [Candidatus Omnitrophota bacterium]
MLRWIHRSFMVAVAFSVLLSGALAAPILPKRQAHDLKRTHDKAQMRSYKYVNTHDLNGDGAVNTKDRLLWINRHRSDVPEVLVSTENVDIYEAMDYNDDGSVSKEEMDAFYTVYDKNGDGGLDEAELEAATD